MSMNNKQKLWYHIAITILFIYVFYNLLSMRKTNTIYGFWYSYVMNKYCFILYILISLFILTLDSYTGVLLLVLAIGTFKAAFKEFFNGDSSAIIDPRYNPSATGTLLETTTLPINTTPPINTFPPVSTTPVIANGTVHTKIVDGQIVADIPVPTQTFLQDTLTVNELQAQALGLDERFKVDDVVVRELLRQIKSQVDFDPYKTELDKEVIYEIYNKYFDNDIFKKLKNNNSDSASYIAAGNFNYVPHVPKVDYDLVTYQNLSNNIGFGITPLADGLANKTKINRG
jgi:hypothetical protein